MDKPLTELELIVMDQWQSDLCQDYPRRAAAEIRWRRAEAEDAIEHAMIAARYIGKLEGDNAKLRAGYSTELASLNRVARIARLLVQSYDDMDGWHTEMDELDEALDLLDGKLAGKDDETKA